jgi:glutamate-1-semialdehyde aminotransferase
MGKAIANGLPLALVGGKKEIMNCEEYFVSSTFAGEQLSLAAASEVIKLLSRTYRLDNLWHTAKAFVKNFNGLSKIIKIEGYPTRGVFQGSDIHKALFFQESCKAGILFGPSFFFTFKHIDYRDQVLNTCRDILTRIKSGSVKLEGEMPSSPFATKARSQ